MPVLLVTGSVVAHDAPEASGAGFDGFISKPFDPDELVEAVYVVGQYTMLSMVANGLRVDVPFASVIAGTAPFDTDPVTHNRYLRMQAVGGSGTDYGQMLLDLLGEAPDVVDVETIPALLRQVRAQQQDQPAAFAGARGCRRSARRARGPGWP